MEKVRNNWFQALASVFKKLAESGETEYIEGVPQYNESVFLRDLRENTSASIQDEGKKENKTGKSGGLKKKYETPTFEAKNMSPEQLEKLAKKLESKKNTKSEGKERVE